MPGMGGGRGAPHSADKGLLSQIIDLLNSKFGTELTEVDQIWFDQQVEAAARDGDLREVAAGNSEENFGYVFDSRFTDLVIDRRAANDDLVRLFFDKSEFKEALTACARREVYQKIQEDLGGAT
jgi:type I restriction enzyme R subunit